MVSKTTMGNTGYRTIKIRTESYDKLQGLVQKLSQDGWGSVGVKHPTPPTLSDVVDVALDGLVKRHARTKD